MMGAGLAEGVGEGFGGDVFRVQFDDDRVFEVSLGEGFDFRRHGGTEEQGLVFVNEAGKDKLDIGEEAHVEHFVGFIQHEGLDVGERQGAVVEQVDETAGGGDENVDAVGKFAFLDIHWKAAIDGKGLNGGELGNLADLFDVLNGQLAGGDEDEGLNLFGGGVDFFEDGDGTGGRFAGTCLGFGDEVSACEDGFECLLLNRG